MKLKSLPSKLIAVLVTGTLMAGLSSGCGNKTNSPTQQSATPANAAAIQAATDAAQKWLTEIYNGQYSQSWQDAAVFFQNAVPEQKWESSMTAFRKPLGNLVSRNLKSSQYLTQLPGAPNGQYVVMQFDTSFANKDSAVETVTFMLESNGQWKSSGYYIK